MATGKKRIGFVDYRLENFHANVFLKILRQDLKDRGFEVAGCYALDAQDGQTWAQKNQVPYFASVEALNKQVDYFAVLAPSNPETHLELCRMVFPCGKTTYVDKTFAPDTATAEAIFALADKHGIVVQTTSSLRYTEVQEHVRRSGGRSNVLHIVSWGGGRSFEEYGIHPTEIVVSCLGHEAESLLRRGTKDHSQLLVNFSGGRTAVIHVYTNARTPYAAAVTTVESTQYIAVDTSRIFVNMAAAMMDLFESGQANIDRRESLAIRRILDAAARPEALNGFVRV
jgi:predicted dehydrogenase